MNKNIHHLERACLTDIFLNPPNLLASRCVAARWENFHSALRRLRVMIVFYSLMQIWVISVPNLCDVSWVIHFCGEILCNLELPNFGLLPRLFFSMLVENWGLIFCFSSSNILSEKVVITTFSVKILRRYHWLLSNCCNFSNWPAY